jgi:hypothetical protein
VTRTCTTFVRSSLGLLGIEHSKKRKERVLELTELNAVAGCVEVQLLSCWRCWIIRYM